MSPTTTPTKTWSAEPPMVTPGLPRPKGTVRCPPKFVAGCPTAREPSAVLQRQSLEESPNQHQGLAYRTPAFSGRPQQVYIFGKRLGVAIDLPHETETADCSCQVISAKGYGHRLLSGRLRYPTFLSEVVPSPFTCQILCAVHCGTLRWCHGPAT